MPEGVMPYPRFEGRVSSGSRILVLVENEIRTALRNPWVFGVLALAAAWALGSIVQFQQLRGDEATHDGSGFFALLDQLLWFAVAAGAAIGGPTLLDDSRAGALELYFSRSLSRFEYASGKVAALLAVTTLTLLVPAVAYWGFSFVFYENHPDWWMTALLSTTVFALGWGLLISGLALGFSAASRSPGAAALLLFGSFTALEYFVDPPALIERVASITSLTEDARFAILSPFAAMEAQQGWLFGTTNPHAFPAIWGMVELAGLTILGWGLLLWRHPRARGETRE